MLCRDGWRRNLSLFVCAAALTGVFDCGEVMSGRGNALTAVCFADDPLIEAPELWLFGAQKTPERSVPLGAKGIRGIIDLRTTTAPVAIELLEDYAKLGQGIVITLRWKRPSDGKERFFGEENYDVPPDPVERANALSVIEQTLTSDAARELGDRIYVQFYNEAGGGPGRFGVDEVDAMLDFATDATNLIREKAPQVRICGPAVTMGQVLYPELADLPGYRDKATVVEKCVAWTAKHADAFDLHLHARDGSDVRTALGNLNDLLADYSGGSDLEIVSWEWSPARFPEREDSEKVRDAILGIWQAMAEGSVKRAAYASYWVGEERKENGANDIYLWCCIMEDSGEPIEPIYSTVEDIGLGRVVLDLPPGDDGDDGNGNGDPFDDSRFAESNTALWVNSVPRSPEYVEELGAAGVRDAIDLRTASNAELRSAIKAFRSTEMGVAITVRWSDPADPAHFDRTPDIRDMSQMKTKLRNALKSSQAAEVAENDLWLQMYDEVAGDHGRIRPADADALFGFATDMVNIVRANAPYVSICGPALSHTELLEKSQLTNDEKERRDMLVRAIDWSIRNADAVDIRVGPEESMDTVVQRVRSYLDSREGGSSLDIVCWRWNGLCAEAGNKKGMTREQIREAILTAFAAMADADLELAAYGPLCTGLETDELSDEQALIDPFGYKQPGPGESYVELAEMIGQYAPDDGNDRHESDSERRKRMNQFKKDYKKIYKDHFKATGDPDWKRSWNEFWKSTWEDAWLQREQQGG